MEVSLETMERDFRRTVSQKIRLLDEGIDRFRVLTLLEDGDHLAIVRKREGARCDSSVPRRRIILPPMSL